MSDDLDVFRQEARAWIQANLEPRTPGGGLRMSDDKTPDEIARARVLQRRLFDAGYAGLTYPSEYGGRGLTPAHERIFRRESAGYETPDFGGAGAVTFGPIGRSLLAHSTPEFLAEHLPKLLSGEELWCQFYSEPEAGSDLAGIRTRAVRDADQWVLNGAKIWSTGAHHADWAMCLARTDWTVPKHRGLTWFAVPTRAPGVTVRPIRQINGSTGFCEEFLEDVRVPDGDRIGEVDQGWSVTQTMLVYERGGGGMGAPAEPRELAPDLVALARRTGRCADPAVRQAIARAHINDYAQHHLARRTTALLRQSDQPQPAIAAYGKLAQGVLGAERARLEIEIAGPAGLLWSADDAAEGTVTATNYLNGRMTAIAAGTNEMQRNGIGERVLGLPREPSFDSTKPFADVLRDARQWTHRVS